MRPGNRDQEAKRIMLEKKRIGKNWERLSKEIKAIQPFAMGKTHKNRIYNDALVSHFRPEISSWSIAYVSN